MSENQRNQLQPQYFTLSPCSVYAHSHPSVIYTELMGAVSVFLYDRKLKVGGANHFRRPHIWSKKNATLEYGNVAMSALIRNLIELGGEVRNMEAQVFGGSVRNHFTFSQRRRAKKNVKAAKKYLKKMNINVVSEDVGGNKVRKIYFNTGTNEVIVLKRDSL